MPIRVLHIVTYMGRGGLETMIMNYYRHIDRTKIQFDFLVHRDFEADYDSEIESLGGKVYRVSRLIPWSSSYKNGLKKFFREHPEYKIVHVHQDCLSSVALRCAKECGVLVRIAHSHNASQDKNWKYLVKRFYMKKIPFYATDFLACSESAGKWMFDGHSFHVLHNAIDTDRYKFAQSVGERVRREFDLVDAFVIGHVGRFDQQKNHNFLVDIFAECLKMNSQCRLMLVGDGNEKSNIQKKAMGLEILDKIIFTGIRSDVNELFQAMDVFVFPSLYEGLPVTMIEAQAASLPSVISDSISEECIVTNGLITRENLGNSAKQWAEHVLQKGNKARESHIEEIKDAGYDIKGAAKKLEQFYIKKSGE